MFAIGVIVSFIIYLTIGYAAGLYVKSEDDYFVAGRGAPTILITGSLVASFLSTVSFMGEISFSYNGYPILLLILVVLNAAGYVAGVLLFGRYLRRSRALTVPEFFAKRFQTRSPQVVTGVTVVVGIGVYLLAVNQGLGLVLSDLLGIEFWQAVIIVWATYASFTIFSGSPGVLLTDTIMFFVFLIGGITGMAWLIGAAGGPTEMMSSLMASGVKPGIMSWHGLTGAQATMGTPAEALAWAIILGFVWGTVVAVSPWQTSRYLMARSEHVCLRSGLVAMVAVLGIYVFLTLGSAAINVFDSNINPSEMAFIWAAENVLPVPVGIVVVSGIFAAGLSSASTFLSLVGFSATHDIAPHFTGRSDKHRLRVARIVMLAVSIVVLLITLVAPPAIFTIGYFAATLFAASWGPAALLSIYSKRVTGRGIALGVAVSFVTVGVLNGLQQFVGVSMPIWIHPVIIGVVVNLIVTMLGSLGAQHNLSEARAAHEQLRDVPVEETSAAAVRTTSGFALAAAAASIGLIALLYFLYYQPLVAATSAL